MKNPEQPVTGVSAAWQSLVEHARSIGEIHLRDLCARRRLAPEAFASSFGPLFVTLARQRFSDETLPLLLALARERRIEQRMAGLLTGACVNVSEARPALHTSLRAAVGDPDPGDTVTVALAERARMLTFAADFAAGRVHGCAGPLSNIVNIGIGGSDLGPRLLADALQERRNTGLRLEFVSNVDGHAMRRTLASLDPARTLFVVASKSFGTIETRANAASARRWLEQHGCPKPAMHFAAVTANPAAAAGIGLAEDRIFRLWDWVGGRYSIWSSVGLPAAATLGPDAFLEFLGGARAMDRHFSSSPLESNLPVLLALSDLWNSAFLDYPTRAIVPYDQRLQLLPSYLAQLIMESLGKSVDNGGHPLFAGCPVIWGGTGTDVQHAFFQLLHQGTQIVPVEFLLAAGGGPDREHQKLLQAACVAQGQALMEGRSDPERPWRTTRGNQPSTTICYKDLTPEVLGMLIALYEHRTFVHAALLDMNPFDQWGVEIGKEMARGFVRELDTGEHGGTDATSRDLLECCRRYGA